MLVNLAQWATPHVSQFGSEGSAPCETLRSTSCICQYTITVSTLPDRTSSHFLEKILHERSTLNKEDRQRQQRLGVFLFVTHFCTIGTPAIFSLCPSCAPVFHLRTLYSPALLFVSHLCPKKPRTKILKLPNKSKVLTPTEGPYSN